MEILDNMPHDRLYTESHQVPDSQETQLLNYLSTIEMSHDGKQEHLEEKIVKLQDHPDPLIKLFLKLRKTMPEMDSITAQKRLASEGSLKRMIDIFRSTLRG